jgi:hypothetical protein
MPYPFNAIPRGAYQAEEIAGVVTLFSGSATAQIKCGRNHVNNNLKRETSYVKENVYSR